MNQEEYIALLFDACEIETRAKRLDFIFTTTGKHVQFVDELNAFDKSRLIDRLKCKKDELQDIRGSKWTNKSDY